VRLKAGSDDFAICFFMKYYWLASFAGHRSFFARMKSWLGSLVPKRLRSKLRALHAYWRMDSNQRRLAEEIIASNVGLHGEKFRFSEDGLCTIHNADFLDDRRFADAYLAGEATGSWRGWNLRWRAYVVCWCAQWAAALEGDFIECGVNKGGNARMILSYLGGGCRTRSFYLLDTFQGFSPELLLPEEKQHMAGSYSYPDCLTEVRATFASFPNVHIIPGAVPGTLAQIDSRKIAFLSIDMNCVEPEIQAATQLWDRVVPGGVIILDDYGFSQHHLQKRAFDLFAYSKGIQVLSLPTGQGLMFKPVTEKPRAAAND
jgi:O-methyltransferase